MKKKLKILLITIITFTLTVSVNAEVEVHDRNTLPNLGVSKKWEITDNNRQNVLNTPKVDSDKKIYDFQNVLTEEEITQLRDQIAEYTEKTGFDLVIVIYNLPYSYDNENETYASDFYDYNDFGLELKGYSGTLLFRNTYEQDPYYDFYMFGDTQLYYQGDGRNDIILDGIYSYLHNGQYYMGFSTYIDYLTDYYNEGVSKDLKNYYVDDMGYLQKYPAVYKIPIIFVLLFSSILTTIVMMRFIKKNKMIRKSIEAQDYLDNSSINYTKREDFLISSHTTHYRMSSDTSSGGGGGGGGFHSSGGSSGGGHSSGGGRHG